MASPLKQKLRKAQPIFGAWTSLGHPSITEAFCKTNFDFIGIDLEHSTISLEQSQAIIAMSQGNGLPCLPRVSSHNGEQIRRLLDSGADGVIVPMVSKVSELDQIVQWVKYPPIGKRSFGVSRGQGYGANFDDYTKEWNDKSILIIQIESIEGVKNIDSLLSNDHVDGVMVGPYDMSGSLGVPGQLFHPDVTAANKKVIEACKKKGISCGTQVVDPTEQNVKAALADGTNFVVLASDVFLLWKWGERMNGLIQSVQQKIKT